MPTITINLDEMKSVRASSTTRLSLGECEFIITTLSEFDFKVYQGGNPDYRVVETASFNKSDENKVCGILRDQFECEIPEIELAF